MSLQPAPASRPPHDAAPVLGAPVPRSGRRARIAVVAAVLTVLLVGALALTGYLWLAADRWRASSQAWEGQARDQAGEVARLGAELEAARGELTAAREQLSTATARITDLADEKAQLGDENVAAQQYVDYQRRVSDAAGVVADALGRCTSGQARLIEYLRTPERYDAAQLEEFRGQVADLCARANDANAALQRELGQ
jgi:chromosome segregation ATPase